MNNHRKLDAPARGLAGNGTVLLVGCGVVNLVTALRLTQRGWPAELFDSAPDPRLDRPWREYGCTRGGGNARMFTVTEADEYGGLWRDGGQRTVFETPPDEHGWDVRRDNLHSVHDQDWIDAYEAVPATVAHRYGQDIHALTRRAGHKWEQLFEAWPELAQATNLQRRILRVYSTPQAVQRAVARHRQVGDLRDVLSADDVRAQFPALALARGDALAGGIVVGGFTLDIHRFVAVAVQLLMACGVRMHFDTEVTDMCTDAAGTIVGVQLGAGTVLADQVVISPGAYGNRLLARMGLGGRIAGVLGIWHTLPNLVAQRQSIKVSRPGAIAEDANITVGMSEGRPSLIVGSGYGFVGTSIDNTDPYKIRVIQRSVDEMMRDLLPDAYEAAGGARWLEHDPTFCLRPWTATSLGLFEVRPTARGQCIVTGGHNTGGFAQAPEVADAVVTTLLGRRHPMQDVYAAPTAGLAQTAPALSVRSLSR